MKRVLFLVTIGLIFGLQAYSPYEVLSVGRGLVAASGTCQVNKEAKCTLNYDKLCENADKLSQWYCKNCTCDGKWVQ